MIDSVPFEKKMIFIGWGAISRGVYPLILRHTTLTPDRVIIIAPEIEQGSPIVPHGAKVITAKVSAQNYRSLLTPLLSQGDHLLNLGVEAGSIALMELCSSLGVTYIDGSIDPWEGGLTDAELSVEKRTNYAMREAGLDLRRNLPKGSPTATPCHGANPGMVSHFVKQGLLNIAKDTGVEVVTPSNQQEWARLAQNLGIKVIHIAERDTQYPKRRRERGEFFNTWSIDGLLAESAQPAEMGWGTHEKKLPHDGRTYDWGTQAAIYLNTPAANVRVRSWTPVMGGQVAYVITHDEAISIADYFTLKEGDKVIYRPTSYYAYHPCDEAMLGLMDFVGSDFNIPPIRTVLGVDDIAGGIEGLGVFFMGNPKGSYWYGSITNNEEVRMLAPNNSATTIQVTAGALAATLYALRHPKEGILTCDELPFEEIMHDAGLYLGDMHGEWTDWTPLTDRQYLFDEERDESDPWQFVNFRIP
jgi:homospermidine synthase